MTPKEHVLDKNPEAKCQKNADGKFEVKDDDKVLGSAGTARMAWAVAWNSLKTPSQK